MENPIGPNSSDSAGESVKRVQRSASEAIDATKDAAKQTIDAAKDAAKHSIEAQTAKVADGAHGAAESLRRAAGEVETEQAWLGTALRKSADGLEAATRSMAGGDINRAVAQLSEFARNQPAVFLGASVALGFALARVGKTAVENASSTTTPDVPRPYQGF